MKWKLFCNICRLTNQNKQEARLCTYLYIHTFVRLHMYIFSRAIAIFMMAFCQGNNSRSPKASRVAIGFLLGHTVRGSYRKHTYTHTHRDNTVRRKVNQKFMFFVSLFVRFNFNFSFSFFLLRFHFESLSLCHIHQVSFIWHFD